MLTTETITSTLSSDKAAKKKAPLQEFYETIPLGEKVLAVVGGGTAALTYLYTAEIEAQYKHIIILGDRGYWGVATHRLAQPYHIFALPHSPTDEFVNPAKHDKEHGITPLDAGSAYVHSRDYQARVGELEEATLEALRKKGKSVFLARERVNTIQRLGTTTFILDTNSGISIAASKVIVATGAGPERRLEPHLQESLSASLSSITASPDVNERILTYTDILTSVVDKCRGKDVLIYGGGATAAWAMEVAATTAKPLAWVGRSGFQLAISAGPRVNEIIMKSRDVQVAGTIESIAYVSGGDSGAKKLLIKITGPNGKKEYRVDYLFNCIGQEPYELGGLPEIISSDIQGELIPYIDKNRVTGTDAGCMLGWTSKQGDFVIIGAAQGTYYDKHKKIERPHSVSQFIPISGQVPITIGGVVSSVCALTNYMPFSQHPKTGYTLVTSLNPQVMNATQLAVFFTASYPGVSAIFINRAVTDFITTRSKTDFGLSPQEMDEFMRNHFGYLPINAACKVLTRPPVREPSVEVLPPVVIQPPVASSSTKGPKDFSSSTIKTLERSPLFGFFHKKIPLLPEPKKPVIDTFMATVQEIPGVDDNLSLPPVTLPESHGKASKGAVEEREVVTNVIGVNV